MKISYNWLKDYIDINQPPDEIADILTNIGLEVEGIETFETLKGGLKGCFVGKVLSCENHPNADKLSVTTVDIGEKEPLPIVCGAPNVQTGQKVVVAKIGTTLYKGNQSLTLEKVKIRGEVSEGMICAEDELGLGDNHDGIMVLDPKAKTGQPAKDYFNIQSDTIIEIGLTPNRIDGGSHLGVARDLAAWFSLHQPKAVKKPDIPEIHEDNTDLLIEVIVEDSIACPRYSGITLTNVKVRESPVWLKTRLLSIGLNPINNIVDITNFVLNELGQPLHAFDADKIIGNQVIIKTLPKGTSFVTLDEIDRKLSADDLMICNTESGMCIAGVLGGIESGVTEKTSNLFLESAHFNPVSVRKTSKRHGINTDASFRFERGSDPDITVFALNRAARLICDLAGAKISSPLIDIYPEPVEPFKVHVRYANISGLIGIDIEKTTIKKILAALEIEIENETEKALDVLVPPYRVDVQREADVIEDILRIYGYSKVELGETASTVLTHSEKPDKENITNHIANYLADNGFNEIMSNSLTKEEYYPDATNTVNILNPLSTDLNRLRTTLFFGGLEAISYNINRQRSDLRFFEFGNCYFFNKGNKGDDILKDYSEEEHLALFLTGKRSAGNWIEKDLHSSFYQLKAFTENLMMKLGFNLDELKYEEAGLNHIDAGLRISSGKKVLVEFGAVAEQFLNQFDIKSDVFYGEFNWNQVIASLNEQDIWFKELPKLPEVKRDLSMVLDKSVNFEDIRKLAFKTEQNILKKIILFDVYEGEKIEKGKKSYAISFILQDEDKTLRDKLIDKTLEKLAAAFESRFKALIRK
ncbi:MAG: phenylalanine--tRNA ligase subunit beta [Bacteroidales bacterium]|nr:phenylalanine--tRNA ligase subunit beta [Bacteroidales bacterium]